VLLNYTTTISVDKSSEEIQKILRMNGATSIRQDYEAGNITAIAFQAQTPYGLLSFRLPANTEAVYKVLCKQVPSWANAQERVNWSSAAKRIVENHKRQADMVAWRILKSWVAAQMAILASEMVSMEEVFLPYMLVNGNTLYGNMISTQFQLKGG
jgi:hypothetical protein